MTPFTTHRSRLVPLLAADVDTDQIIPAQYVNVQGRAALAAALFANRRRDEPDFVLNRAEMAGRSVLLAGANFGCGSSREAAAWALQAAGFRALVAPSFNDTFFNNCTKNGLLPIRVDAIVHERICAACAADAATEIAIDLVGDTAALPGTDVAFRIGLDPFVRELLVHGIDELDYLRERLPHVRAYEARQAGRGRSGSDTQSEQPT